MYHTTPQKGKNKGKCNYPSLSNPI